jgi:hypothetical protein
MNANQILASEAYQNAKVSIGQIEKNMSRFMITRGQFSMIDIVAALLNQTGPAKVSIWTWCVADYELDAFEFFFNEKSITDATLVIDIAGQRRNVDLVKRWVNLFGENSCRVVKNHAKIATVYNDDWQLLARGSMNLNNNPRYEQCDISEGGQPFDLVKKVEKEMPFTGIKPDLLVAKKATGFDNQNMQLKAFEHLKLFQM